jgi:hypothetical protein
VPGLESKLTGGQGIFHVVESLDLTEKLIILSLINDDPFLLVADGVLHKAINVGLFLD